MKDQKVVCQEISKSTMHEGMRRMILKVDEPSTERKPLGERVTLVVDGSALEPMK